MLHTRATANVIVQLVSACVLEYWKSALRPVFFHLVLKCAKALFTLSSTPAPPTESTL